MLCHLLGRGEYCCAGRRGYFEELHADSAGAILTHHPGLAIVSKAARPMDGFRLRWRHEHLRFTEIRCYESFRDAAMSALSLNYVGFTRCSFGVEARHTQTDHGCLRIFAVLANRRSLGAPRGAMPALPKRPCRLWPTALPESGCSYFQPWRTKLPFVLLRYLTMLVRCLLALNSPGRVSRPTPSLRRLRRREVIRPNTSLSRTT